MYASHVEVQLQSGKTVEAIQRTTPKKRDPSWRTRHALGHKVEPNPKAYTRKRKHPEENDLLTSTVWCHLGAIIELPRVSHGCI